MNKQECLDKLDYISKLEYDWDSYGSEIIPDEVITKTKELLEAIEYKYVYFIAPFSAGIEIELSNGNEYPCASIDITTDGYGLLVCPDRKDFTWDEFDEVSINFIVNRINKIFK